MKRRVPDERHQSIQLEMISHILKMLQDSDPDVRGVAARAATKHCLGLQHPDEEFSLPEWTLERTFPLAFSTESADTDQGTVSSLINGLVEIILECCGDLLSAMKHVQAEFKPTGCFPRSTTSPLDKGATTMLVNANTTRKIFEDEDPNPFQEKLLLAQLASRSLLDLCTSCEAAQSSHHSLTLLQQVSDLCESALTLLLEEDLTAGGFVHDLSRFPSIFPPLHGILCATSVLTMRSLAKAEDETAAILQETLERIQRSAEQLLSNRESARYLHPEIVHALQVIRHGQTVDMAKEDVNGVFFLLNESMVT